MNRFLLILWLLVDAVVVYGSKEIRCNSGKMLAEVSECPKTAMCKEEQDGRNGLCLCKNDSLKFNPKYTNADDYCIYNEKYNNTKSGTKPNDDDSNMHKVVELPGAKHVAAGIFLPILFVIILIGGILAYKKLHITQRIRNFRRNRRTRPFYGDVSLGMNDNDDPPLI